MGIERAFSLEEAREIYSLLLSTAKRLKETMVRAGSKKSLKAAQDAQRRIENLERTIAAMPESGGFVYTFSRITLAIADVERERQCQEAEDGAKDAPDSK